MHIGAFFLVGCGARLWAVRLDHFDLVLPDKNGLSLIKDSRQEKLGLKTANELARYTVRWMDAQEKS